MERIQKQQNSHFSAIRRWFGSSAPSGNRAPHSGEGFTRWMREFESKNRVTIQEGQARYHKA